MFCAITVCGINAYFHGFPPVLAEYADAFAHHLTAASRRTQSYLLRVLADSRFSEGIVLFNGSNTDDRSKQIYAAWLERHQGTDRISGSKSADMRSALVDYFREEGRIMIATEAGAEGMVTIHLPR